MTFTEYVEAEKIKARLNNIEEVRQDINESWVQDKINSHILAFNGIFSVEEITEAILSNDIVASKFCKDPGKQNISEKLAEKVLGISKLPAQGKNCIRFNEKGDIVSISSGNTKSADFYYNGYYATQKYTNEKGGAQDNQRDDVIHFLKFGSINYKVAAIVDGNYWDNGHRDELREMFRDNPNVLITSVTEIKGGNIE